MTDQTIPNVTDDDRRRAREWAEGIEANPKSWSLLARTAARVVLDTVPTPPLPLPTLADMCDEERAACRWMQADVENRSVRYVIVTPYDAEGDAALTSADGGIEWMSPERVTPRPDLPRMTWPGDQTADPADAVPESTLNVGSEWDDADALARACRESGRDQIIALDRAGDAYTWSEAAEWWESVSPMSVNVPFTILHEGKKADQ